jgi:hypothetical protein
MHTCPKITIGIKQVGETRTPGQFVLHNGTVPKPKLQVVQPAPTIRSYPPFSVNESNIEYDIDNPLPAYPYNDDASVYHQTFSILGSSYGNGNYSMAVNNANNNLDHRYLFLNQYQKNGFHNYSQGEGLKFSSCSRVLGDGSTNTTIDFIFTLPTAIKLNKITWVSRYGNISESVIDFPTMGRIYGIHSDGTETLVGELNISDFTFASRYDNFYKNTEFGNRDSLDINCSTDQFSTGNFFNKFRIKMHSYIDYSSYRIDTKYIILYEQIYTKC